MREVSNGGGGHKKTVGLDRTKAFFLRKPTVILQSSSLEVELSTAQNFCSSSIKWRHIQPQDETQCQGVASITRNTWSALNES